jgi:hypothetical protein
MAIEDAYILAQELGTINEFKQIPDAIDRFHQQRYTLPLPFASIHTHAMMTLSDILDGELCRFWRIYPRVLGTSTIPHLVSFEMQS